MNRTTTLPPFAFRITRDRLAEEFGDEPKLRTIALPSTDADAVLATDRAVRARVQDDDGVTYFEGKLSDPDHAEELLWGWAMPCYGCTRVQIRKGNGPWSTVLG